MKKIFICALSLLTAALFFVSCTEDSTLYCETTKPQFNSLSDPKAVAFFHNATIEAYLETRGRIDSRGWFGTFADAAGSLICAGCGVWPGIVVSAIFSLNANYGEPNFDDCMDTNCD